MAKLSARGRTEYDIVQLVKKLSPSTALEFNPTGRLVKIQGPDGEAKVWQGTDGHWRVKTGSLVDLVVDMRSGVLEALKWCDGAYDEREFRRLADIAKAGEVEDEAQELR